MITQEKHPQDWALAERLALIIQCDALSDEAISKACRHQGIFPHHVTQWKQDVISNRNGPADPKKQITVKQLSDEIKELNKDLHRKNKALAETAALLVLQKKSTQSGEVTRTADGVSRSQRDHHSHSSGPALGSQAVCCL